MTFRRALAIFVTSMGVFLFSCIVYIARISDTSLKGLDRKNYTREISMGKIRARFISSDGKFITNFRVEYRIIQINSKDSSHLMERREIESLINRKLKIEEYKYLGFSEFKDLTDKDVYKIMENKYRFKTIIFVPYTKRILECKSCYHVVGNVSVDGDGLGGLEKIYNGLILGNVGYISFKVDAYGHVVSPPVFKSSININDVILSLRYDLYELADSLFKNYRRGAVFMFNPQNGYVYLAYSKPSPFDTVVSRKDAPILNRAVSGLYPPGSTFKPLIALLALREGIIDTNFGVFCPGYLAVGRHIFGCWMKHGYVSFKRAISHSCDVYFYNIGGRFGARKLLKTLGSTGLFDRRFTNLREEVPSRIPVKSLYLGTALNIAIGQGEVLVTPVFMAVIAGLIGNMGSVVLPRFSPYEKEKVFVLKAPEWAYRKVKEGMLKVVEEGTAFYSKIPGFEFGGKTGTAQNPHGEDHSLFIAFAPYDKPEVAIAVLVENAGHGSTAAAPIASALIRKFFNIQP